jgi:hypothetical protein
MVTFCTPRPNTRDAGHGFAFTKMKAASMSRLTLTLLAGWAILALYGLATGSIAFEPSPETICNGTTGFMGGC